MTPEPVSVIIPAYRGFYDGNLFGKRRIAGKSASRAFAET